MRNLKAEGEQVLDRVRSWLAGDFGSKGFWGRVLSPESAVTAFAFMLADLIDKPLWVLGVISDGRFIGHTLLIWVLVAGAFYLVKPAYGWFALAGGLLHRLLDVFAFMPWFYPFKQYDWPTVDYHGVVTWFPIVWTFLEMAVVVCLVSLGVAAVMGFLSSGRKRRSVQK